MLKASPKLASRYVSAADHRALAQIANAFINSEVGPGIFLSLNEAESIFGMAADNGTGQSQTGFASTLAAVPYVKPGDAIDPEKHWNPIIALCNAFRNLRNGPNAIVTKAEGLFILEQAITAEDGTTTARTSGSVDAFEKQTSPFISRETYERLARFLNALRQIIGRNGVRIIVSQGNVLFELGTPLPAIVADDTTPIACELPDFSNMIGKILGDMEPVPGFDTVDCGGLRNFPLILDTSAWFTGTETCLYKVRITLEGNLPVNGPLGEFAGAFLFLPSGTIGLTGENGPDGCGMAIKTQSFEVELSPNPIFPFTFLMVIDAPPSVNTHACYVKIANVELISSHQA